MSSRGLRLSSMNLKAQDTLVAIYRMKAEVKIGGNLAPNLDFYKGIQTLRWSRRPDNAFRDY